MSMADPYAAAIAHWTAHNVPMLPGLAEGEIRSIFAEMGQPLSNDVLKLYMTIGGFVNFACDGHWSLWSLDRIREMQSYRTDWHRQNSVLWFADFLISSHYYGFQFIDAERSAVCLECGSGDEQYLDVRAESVGHFLELYLHQPDSLDVWDLDRPPAISPIWEWFRRIKSRLLGPPPAE